MSRAIDADQLMNDINKAINGMSAIGIEVDGDWLWAKLHDAVDNAPTIKPEPKWIPCSERLPEEDGEYLVLYYTRSKYKPYMYDVISFTNDLYQINEYDFYNQKGQKGWFYCDREYGFCKDNDVIAWMPLPEPKVEK